MNSILILNFSSVDFNDSIQLGEFGVIDDNVITIGSANCLQILDITHEKIETNLQHTTRIQHICYNSDKNVVHINADKKIGSLDIRDRQHNMIADSIDNIVNIHCLHLYESNE